MLLPLEMRDSSHVKVGHLPQTRHHHDGSPLVIVLRQTPATGFCDLTHLRVDGLML